MYVSDLIFPRDSHTNESFIEGAPFLSTLGVN